MLVNFEIEDNVHLCCNGRTIDLHNNFDFVSFEFKISERELILKWIKSSGDWVDENELAEITIVHNGVFYYSMGYENEIYEFPDDDKCLAGLTFISSSDREINNELFPRTKPDLGTTFFLYSRPSIFSGLPAKRFYAFTNSHKIIVELVRTALNSWTGFS